VILLRSQMEAVAESFRKLRASDRERPITTSEHAGGSPWSANDHLAHVVQSEWGFLAIGQRLVANDADPVRLARRGNTSEERNAFVNKENQDQVRSRRGQGFAELLEELRNVCEQRIQLLMGLTDEELARPVPGSDRVDQQWAALLGSTHHAEAHVEIVRRALAQTRP
jgi:DinB superfamily